MFKKIFAIAVALSALGLVLAGCQSGGEAGGGETPKASDAEKTGGDGK